MSPASIICSYVYQSFLVVKAALEGYIPLAKEMLKMLDALYNSALNLIKYVYETMLETIVDGIKVFQKYITDLIMGGSNKIFCLNLFKCNIFLEELSNPNSLIARTLEKAGIINEEQRSTINDIIKDFDSFADNVCKNGFTFEFGMSAINSIVRKYLSQLDEMYKFLMRKKEELRRKIEKYLDYLVDLGVFDALDKLKKYFNCVIDALIPECSNNNTSVSFYKDALAKMHLEESDEGYTLETKTKNKMLDTFNSKITQIDNMKDDLRKAIDEGLLDPNAVTAAKNAFNLSENVFPGGMSWTDVKKGRLSKNVAYNYFKIKRRELINAFSGKDYTADQIMNGLTIDDGSGFIKVNVEGEETTIKEKDDFVRYDLNYDEIYGNNKITDSEDQELVYSNSEEVDLTKPYVDENDNIISSRQVVIEMRKNPEGSLAQKVKSLLGYVRFIKESETVGQW